LEVSNPVFGLTWLPSERHKGQGLLWPPLQGIANECIAECLTGLHTVSPFLEYRLELWLVLLVCFLVLLEAFLAQIFYRCLLHC